ncbi:MAG: N-acetyltransferase [Lachnospiraceae bacterium]|nr:N-acetyltransferase [Lachnospiraceae bacterium]
MKEEITIRAVTEQDAEALLAIYAPYVEQTAITYEYETPTLEEFRGRIRCTLEKYPYLAAVRGEEIVGYAYAGPLHERAAYQWSAELTVYVKMEERGRGIGRMLYERLEACLKKMGVVLAAACIAWPEKEDEYLTFASVRFHEKMGYARTARFHDCAYKFKRWYGMAWMEKQIGERTEDQKPVRPFREIWEKEEPGQQEEMSAGSNGRNGSRDKSRNF